VREEREEGDGFAVFPDSIRAIREGLLCHHLKKLWK
jgi:hypothetical protein